MITPPAMFSIGESIEVLAPAKVNLFLEIIGERANGYHDIRSALVPISIYDRLTVSRTVAGLETRIVEGSVDASCLRDLQGENLTTRAARALSDATGFQGGALIELEKHIPIGGGLGGGSADAAAALIALNQVWGTGLNVEELASLGANIGCDVPGLLYGGPVQVTGLGEIVSRLSLPGTNGDGSWWLVVANPNLSVSTRDIYSRYRGGLTSRPDLYKRIVFALESGDVVTAAGALYNGLQSTVVEKYPLIGIILNKLHAAGSLGTLVSGSGASAFGLARSRQHADEVEAALKEELGGSVWTSVAKTLPDGVMVAHGPLEA